MKEIPILERVSSFFFNLPLYQTVELSNDCQVAANLLQKNVWEEGKLLASVTEDTWDNYCPVCKREATFTRYYYGQRTTSVKWEELKKSDYDFIIDLICTRKGHSIRFWVRMNNMKLTKIGQFPSLADIANDEVSQYRKFMDPEDASEFHKAIGLAAHGVGVGSFVYLRRIFENLIYRRFAAHASENKWKEEVFKKLRMNEKIEFIKDYLPDFIVENSKIYSILSRGVHELDEQECLAIFEPIKQSIILILEQDRELQRKLELQANLTKAIENFGA